MVIRWRYVVVFMEQSRNNYVINVCFTYNTYLLMTYATVNGYLELTILKGVKDSDDAISTLNLEVYKFWIGESPHNLFLNMVKFEALWILNERAFYCFHYFLCLKVNLDLEKRISLVNLHPIVTGKRWTDGESWPNDFVEKVNRGEDLRWVGSSCRLANA